MQSVKRADMERLAQYRQYLYTHPRLTYLFFELTDACNLSCLHCGSHAGPRNRTYLPITDVKMVLDQVALAYSPGTIMICLTGGEPLLHPNLFEIIAYARQLGFSCGITTNGMLIDDQAAEALVRSGVNTVTFSLDGLSDTHDRFRNQAGSFEKTLQGIRNLQQAAGKTIPTQITTVIHKQNIHQLEELYAVVSGLGVDSWRVINMEPIGRALENRELLLDGPQLRQLLSFIQECRFCPRSPMEVTYGCSHYVTENFERMVRDNYFLCGSGILVASILCNGDIYSCLDIERREELIQGNIRTHNFVDVWENRFQPFRRNRTSDCEMCRQCEDRTFCCGDSGHTWDYETHTPLLCAKQLLDDLEVTI